MKYIIMIALLVSSINAFDFGGLVKEVGGLSNSKNSTKKAKKRERPEDIQEKKCNDGNFEECNKLGYSYATGEGVSKDYKKADVLFTKGCDGGNAKACGRSAYLYINGYGVTKDIEKARLLYKKGCDGDDKHSCENYVLMEKEHKQNMCLKNGYDKYQAEALNYDCLTQDILLKNMKKTKVLGATLGDLVENQKGFAKEVSNDLSQPDTIVKRGDAYDVVLTTNLGVVCTVEGIFHSGDIVSLEKKIVSTLSKKYKDVSQHKELSAQNGYFTHEFVGDDIYVNFMSMRAMGTTLTYNGACGKIRKEHDNAVIKKMDEEKNKGTDEVLGDL